MLGLGLPAEKAAGLRFRLEAHREPPDASSVYQDWQSVPARGVSFFSAAYLAAVDLTSGLMIC